MVVRGLIQDLVLSLNHNSMIIGTEFLRKMTQRVNGVLIVTRKNKKTPSREEILMAKMVRSLNWKVIDGWREKCGCTSNMEFCMKFDTGELYEEGYLKRRSPFQTHVRNNIDHMIHTGVMSPQEQVEYLADFKKRGGTLQMLTRSIDYVEGA